MSIVPTGLPSVRLGSCLCNQPHELQIFVDSMKYNVGVTFTFFLFVHGLVVRISLHELLEENNCGEERKLRPLLN